MRWLDRYGELADRLDDHRVQLAALEAKKTPPATRAEWRAELQRLLAIDLGGESGEPSIDVESIKAFGFQKTERGLVATGDPPPPEEIPRKFWRFRGPRADEFGWKLDVRRELIEGLERFSDPENGTLASVRRRLQTASTIKSASVDEHRVAWDAAVARIRKHPSYSFTMKPQVGLIPLGPDTRSGLEEFLHLETHAGPVPCRSADGAFAVTGDLGIILVLIPSGRFWMGCQKENPDGTNHDPGALVEERLREVDVKAPFLLSKYEVTQGQWARLPAANAKPSRWQAGFKGEGMTVAVDDRHPVEQVSWDDCRLALSRVGLGMPSDEQWEYAARAGSSTVWPGTSDVARIPRFGNIAGEEAARIGWSYTEAHISDAWIIHGPVGRLEPNGYGLHDVLGNVWEWTSSAFDEGAYSSRGGSFNDSANGARVANRLRNAASYRSNYLGVRAAMKIAD